MTVTTQVMTPTAQKVMEALVDLIVDGELPDFSVQQVADRAGVSHRTVYRHFPTRDALLEALAQWVEDRMGLHNAMPTDIASLPATVDSNYRLFEADRRAVEALTRLSVGGGVQPSRRRARTDAFQRVVRRDFPDLDSDGARLGAAVVRVLASSRTWLNLRESGLDGADSARAAAWAVAVLSEALAAGRVPIHEDMTTE